MFLIEQLNVVDLTQSPQERIIFETLLPIIFVGSAAAEAIQGEKGQPFTPTAGGLELEDLSGVLLTESGNRLVFE